MREGRDEGRRRDCGSRGGRGREEEGEDGWEIREELHTRVGVRDATTTEVGSTLEDEGLDEREEGVEYFVKGGVWID